MSGENSGTGSAVLDAPEVSHVPGNERGRGGEAGVRGSWQGRGPAPAGALQRGYAYGDDTFEGPDGAEPGDADAEEQEYVPRRAGVRAGWRAVPKTLIGRIALGVAAVLVVGALFTAVAAGRRYMLHDPRFVLATTDDIQIEGAKHLTREQALNVFGADLERNIFRVPLGERRADLERLPWVEHATVMRLLPNSLRVSIKERTPVAFVRQGTQIGLVDANGVLLDMPTGTVGESHYSFPVLTGLNASQTWQQRAERMQVYERFMAAMSGAGDHLTDSLSEVDVTDPEDVKSLIASGGADVMVHFGDEEFVKRYREFEEHLPEWRRLYPNLGSADMRYEGQVVLEMQGGGPGAVRGAASGAGNGPGNASVPGSGAGVLSASASGAGRAADRPGKVETARASSVKAVPDARRNESSGVLAAAVKPAVSKPTVRAAAAKRPVSRKRSGKGKDAANERVFAALAAAHKAALEKKAAADR